LEVTEAKLNERLNEIEPLIPSVKELQNVGITFDLIMPYIMAINEKSVLHNTNLKTGLLKIIEN
jgi:hypothetical protein